MKAAFRFGAAVAVAAVLAYTASAQQPPGGGRGFGGFGGGGRGMLLGNPGVQKELKLTEDQVKKIHGVGEQLREKLREDFAKLGDREISQEDRQAVMKKIGEESNKAYADAKILKPDQEKRLEQIELQVKGARAFQDEKVVTQLKINDDQKEKIKTIIEDSDKERRELFQGAQGNFQGVREKMTALNKETMDKVNAVLTDDQKKSWKDMAGAHFELQMQPRGNRGGGRPAAGGAGSGA